MTYTPTTDEVEHRYAYDELYSMDCEADHHAFRRWLAAHDAEVAAKALRDAADDIAARANDSALITNADRWGGYYHGMRSGMQNEEQALRIRADRLEDQ